jgi:RNA polymerase sigma-70 factor, ECF subfamily
MEIPPPSVPPESPDAELVRQCLGGRREAFAELTRRYYRPVCGFVLKRVEQPALVEDLVQETFLEAYRSLTHGRPPTHFASWLFGIAHNRCGKWLRRRRPILFPATEPPDMAATPPAFSAAEELEEQQRLLASLEGGLALLPEDIQALLRMKHQQGKTCDQIAGELDRPVGTVKSQLARAYKSLRVHLSRSLGRADL